MHLVGWISTTATTTTMPPIIVVAVVAVAVVVAIPVIVVSGPNEIIVHVEAFSMRNQGTSGTRR